MGRSEPFTSTGNPWPSTSGSPSAIASTILLLIPGPTILLVVSYALGQGRRSALATVAGVAIGDAVAMTASMLGVGALLAASAGLFTAG